MKETEFQCKQKMNRDVILARRMGISITIKRICILHNLDQTDLHTSRIAPYFVAAYTSSRHGIYITNMHLP